MKLIGRTALVTGAGSGIGRAISQAYALEGANVVCSDKDAATAEDTARAIGEAGGTAISVCMDVTKQDEIDAAIAACSSRFGGVDTVLNAAGILRYQPILETTRETFRESLEVNLLGVFFVSQAAARDMIAGGRQGAIINIASIAGRSGGASALQYSASKSAVISVTQSMAQAWVQQGINVNAIAPGYIGTTNMWKEIQRVYSGTILGSSPEEIDANIVSTVPLGRLGRAEDICGTAVFLASEDARYIAGQTLNVDGCVQFH